MRPGPGRGRRTWLTVRNFAAAGAALEWDHGRTYIIQHDFLPFGLHIVKVVLIRAGSVTHHSDSNQRCVELAFLVRANTDPVAKPGYVPTLQVTVPTLASGLRPRGHYMLFLVTDAGGISIPATTPRVTAPWVEIE